MGAYSRSRMRQLVLGGFTQHMLFDTSRPVFVVHD
jgi:nucleotide-binding universal stress UspA family protein